MYGAIIGDIVGSRFEFNPIKSKDFDFWNKDCCFTDDTVCTVAVADIVTHFFDVYAMLQSFSDEWSSGFMGAGPVWKGYGGMLDKSVLNLENREKFLTYGKVSDDSQLHISGKFDRSLQHITAEGITEVMQIWCRAYDNRGYGGGFSNWIYSSRPAPYNSFGNGAGMRISPVAFCYRDNYEAARLVTQFITEITHNHPEGLTGAQAVTRAIWLALNNHTADDIRQKITEEMYYDMDRSVDQIREYYRFTERCCDTVPEAIICALESDGVEDAIRNAVSLGGDADTLAAIAGAIAEAMYGIDDDLIYTTREKYLDKVMVKVMDKMYCLPEK